MSFAIINVAIDIRKKERRNSLHRTRTPVEAIALPWIEKMKISGWEYRGSHLWHKFHDPQNVYYHTPRNGTHRMPAISGGTEMILVFLIPGTRTDLPGCKKQDYIDDSHLLRKDSSALWCIPNTSEQSKKRWHECPWPEELAARAIRRYSWPGDVVLDPFSGAGTSIVVARKLGRAGIGCEISFETIKKSLFYINQMDMFANSQTVDMTV